MMMPSHVCSARSVRAGTPLISVSATSLHVLRIVADINDPA